MEKTSFVSSGLIHRLYWGWDRKHEFGQPICLSIPSPITGPSVLATDYMYPIYPVTRINHAACTKLPVSSDDICISIGDYHPRDSYHVLCSVCVWIRTSTDLINRYVPIGRELYWDQVQVTFRLLWHFSVVCHFRWWLQERQSTGTRMFGVFRILDFSSAFYFVYSTSLRERI